MSEQLETIFVPESTADEKTFTNGGSIIKLGFKVESLIPFLKEHVGESGWINFAVCRVRPGSKSKRSHYIKLDTWKAKDKEQPANEERPTPKEQPAPKAAQAANEDDVPF